MAKTKAIITGGHGFIGSHLATYLEGKGIVSHCINHNRLKDAHKLKDILREYNPDYIFHLAAYGNMAHQKEPGQIVGANIIGTFNLLQASLDVPYKAFITVGSSSEYGKKDKPMTEDMLPEVDTFYGASKVAAAYLARAFAKQYTKPIVTVRPFSVYGEKEAPFRFIPQLIQHLTTGQVMNIDEEAKHDWIYIDDLVEGMFVVSQHARELFGQVVNIGTGIQSSNYQIEKILEQISGKTLTVNYFSNMRPSDSPIWVDGSKKLRSFGWKPKISLEEGLRRCYEYYTKQKP